MSGAGSGTWTQAKHDKHVVRGPRHGMRNKECMLAVTILGKVFLILRRKLIEICLSESAEVQQPPSGAVQHSRRHFSLWLGNFFLTQKQTVGHFGFNELSRKRSEIPSTTFLINLLAVPASEKPRQPPSPLSHPTEISQACTQTLHPYSLLPWQVMISAIRQIPQTNTSDSSLLQDGLMKWTNFPTEESLCVAYLRALLLIWLHVTSEMSGSWHNTFSTCWTVEAFLIHEGEQGRHKQRDKPLNYWLIEGLIWQIPVWQERI